MIDKLGTLHPHVVMLESGSRQSHGELGFTKKKLNDNKHNKYNMSYKEDKNKVGNTIIGNL